MKLNRLVAELDIEFVRGNLDLKINNISYDSRKSEPNSLFICIEGFKTDGHKYIDEAVRKGAIAVLIERDLENYIDDIVYIKVADSRKAMSYISAEFYNHPLAKLKLIGVTGTNGKTTTTHLIKSVLEEAGKKTGLIGTIGNFIEKKELPATRTTPNSLELYKLFKKMFDKGIEYVVMEVSSHAIDLKRVIGMEFEAAVFTNISQDHLDYHKTLAKYIDVKSRLFAQVKAEGFSIINNDDGFSHKIIDTSSAAVSTYSIEEKSDFQAKDIRLSAEEISFSVNNFPEKIKLNLTGKFNVYNALAAFGVGHLLQFDFEIIKNGLEKVGGVAGRFELVKEGQNFTLIVDYAHTPDGMQNVLKTIKGLPCEKIIVVFGCGGDRDKKKRPLMGEIVAEFGDYFIITTDNPRSESPKKIIKDIEKGIKDTKKERYKVIVDRKEAIDHAVKIAQKDDVVVIFGKGHETYQIFFDKTIHFDDREVARNAIKSIKEERI